MRFRKLDSAARTFPMAANQARIFSRNSKCNAPCMDTEPGVWSCPVSVIEKSAFPPLFFCVAESADQGQQVAGGTEAKITVAWEKLGP